MPAAGRKRPAPFPPLDEHLVEPEITRDEIVRGRKVVAMPALPPHGDQHCGLDFLIFGHVGPEYQASTDLVTRLAEESDFATDTSVRRKGIDPATGERYLEELSFEVVNTQSEKEVRERAEDLVARGVRRVFAVFVKKKQVAEWSAKKRAFVALGSGAVIKDPALVKPLQARAILDAAEAKNEIARSLLVQNNPVLEEVQRQREEAGLQRGLQRGLQQGRAETILAVMRMRFGELPPEMEVRVLRADAKELDTFLARCMSADSAEQVIAGT
jgi:S1-C subfamily serine protease